MSSDISEGMKACLCFRCLTSGNEQGDLWEPQVCSRCDGTGRVPIPIAEFYKEGRS